MYQDAEYQRWWVGAHVYLPGSRHPLHVRVSRWWGRRRWQVRTAFSVIKSHVHLPGSRHPLHVRVSRWWGRRRWQVRTAFWISDPDSLDLRIRIGNPYPDQGRQKWSGAGHVASPSWRSNNKYIAIFLSTKVNFFQLVLIWFFFIKKRDLNSDPDSQEAWIRVWWKWIRMTAVLKAVVKRMFVGNGL